ncbi:heavy metal response regulator transcription factor [Methylophaga sp.]|jgi:two-component system copper resistance phosphate regulon response regulator CusR|uniref:heavy metal response regulator transcription factor n=1 Tax=Methylophaga sp. TaxID=2024840 RepID=UPI0013FEC553|nr:heavy metal response regulator transcription factor [Methylophaga sp.]MTI64814.1 response regulator [Methylophaga sp.]
MRLLIIEDDEKTGKYLTQGLTEASFVVSWVRHGIDGLHEQANTPFDLIILDRMLPDMDGLQVLKQLQGRGPVPPVLLLTAKDSIEDRVSGLEAGADDYLVKPFAFAELLARIRTLLRRGQQPVADTRLTLADLEIDLVGRRVYRNGKQIRLTAKEFALLELLLRHQGQVLPRSMIASMVWDINFDSDTNVIDVAIRRLRAKIDDDFEQKLIHTVRGMGYVCDATARD